MSMTVRVDYHLHSDCSDGIVSPEQIVRTAHEVGLKEIAIADHNSLIQFSEAQKEADKLGIFLIRACEITACIGKNDFHILAYGIKRINPLKEFLDKEKKNQEKRAYKTVAKLKELGWAIDLRRIKKKKKSQTPLGRVIIVRHIMTNLKNLTRLRQERIRNDVDFYSAYLDPGCPAFYPRKKSKVAYVVKKIKEAGGIAIWAHPIWTLTKHYEKMTAENFQHNFKRMLKAKIDGIEVFYPGVSEAQARSFYHLCWRYNLIITAGSDWHGDQTRKNMDSAPGNFPKYPDIGPDMLSKVLRNRG